MLTLPVNFKKHLIGKDTQLVPLVLIGNYSDGTYIRISPEHRKYSSQDSFPLLLNIPSLKESFDINSRKYKISSLSLQFSNVKYGGKRLSERFSGSMVNTEVRIYWTAPNSHSLQIIDVDSAMQVYYGKIRRYTHDTEKLTLSVEDNSQDTFHKDLPLKTIDSTSSAPEKYIGKYIPIVYGWVDKAPCVFTDHYESLTAGDQIWSWIQNSNPFYTDKGPINNGVNHNSLWSRFTPIWIWTGSDYINLAAVNLKDQLQILPTGHYTQLANIQSTIISDEQLILSDNTTSKYGSFRINLKGRSSYTDTGAGLVNDIENVSCLIWDFSSDYQAILTAPDYGNADMDYHDIPRGSLSRAIGGRLDDPAEIYSFLADNPIDWTGSRRGIAVSQHFGYNIVDAETIYLADLVLFYDPQGGTDFGSRHRDFFNIDFRSIMRLRWSDSNNNNYGPVHYEYLTLQLNIKPIPSNYERAKNDTHLSGKIQTDDDQVIKHRVFGIMINGHNISYLCPAHPQPDASGSTTTYEAVVIQSNYNSAGNYSGQLKNDIADKGDWINPASDTWYLAQKRAKERISHHDMTELEDVFHFNTASENTLNNDEAAFNIGTTYEKVTDTNNEHYKLTLDLDNSNLKGIRLLRLGSMLNPFKYEFYASCIGRININGTGSISTVNAIVNDILSEYLDIDDPIDVNSSTGRGWVSESLRDSPVLTSPFHWIFSFSVNEKINSKKLIEELCSVTPFIPYFSNMGEFKFAHLRSTYQDFVSQEVITTEKIPINANDIVSFNFSKTDIEDVYTAIELKYKWDYAKEEYTKNTNTLMTQIGISEHIDTGTLTDWNSASYIGTLSFENSLVDYDAKKEYNIENKILSIESKYITDEGVALMAASMLLSWHCNQHLVLKLKLPLKYMNIEIGDFVKFDKLIGDIVPYGISYSEADNEEIRVNGQKVYNSFMVTETNKTTKYCQITCIQEHVLNILTPNDYQSVLFGDVEIVIPEGY